MLTLESLDSWRPHQLLSDSGKKLHIQDTQQGEQTSCFSHAILYDLQDKSRPEQYRASLQIQLNDVVIFQVQVGIATSGMALPKGPVLFEPPEKIPDRICKLLDQRFGHKANNTVCTAHTEGHYLSFCLVLLNIRREEGAVGQRGPRNRRGRC